MTTEYDDVLLYLLRAAMRSEARASVELDRDQTHVVGEVTVGRNEPRYLLRGDGDQYDIWDTILHRAQNDVTLTKQQALYRLIELNAPVRPTWDQTWMAVAEVIAKRSRCDRRMIGAVIVTADNQVAAASYNGPPAGMHVEGRCTDWCPRAQRGSRSVMPTDYHSCPAIHAESNALLRADRTRINGGTVYVTGSVCMDCAKLVANSGLARVVMSVSSQDAHRNPTDVIRYLRGCELTVKAINPRGDEVNKP
jgi:dCMP deaminase